MVYDRVTCQLTLWHLFLWITLVSVLLAIARGAIPGEDPLPHLIGIVVLHTLIDATSLMGCVILILRTKYYTYSFAGHWLLYGHGCSVIGIQLIKLRIIFSDPPPAEIEAIVLPLVNVFYLIPIAAGAIYIMVAFYYTIALRRVCPWRWTIGCGAAAAGMLSIGVRYILMGIDWRYGGWWVEYLRVDSGSWLLLDVAMLFTLIIVATLDAVQGVQRDLLHWCGVGVVCGTVALWVVWLVL